MILQACPRCSRQYDVTHLVPTSKVRCVCDERFEVSWTRPFTVERLQCGNCGGAVDRQDRACGYCGTALAEDQRRMDSLCPSCYARIREDSRHCRACGVEIRPQSLTPIPDGKACPRCEAELRIRMLDEVSVIECSACEGMWVQAATFDRLCHEARTGGPRGGAAAHERVRVASAPDPVRYIPCLTCGELLFRRQFRYADRPSGVILDRCKDHGVWLDRDELEQVVRFLEKVDSLQQVPRRASRSIPSLPIEGGTRRRGSNPVADALGFIGDLLFGDLFFD